MENCKNRKDDKFGYNMVGLTDTCHKTWTQADGSVIKIRDMTDSHLKNCINMLERNAQSIYDNYLHQAFNVLNFVQGDMAQYYIETEMDNLSYMSAEDFIYEYTEYKDLIEELQFRALF